MQRKHLLGLVFIPCVTLALVSIFGCRSSPQPPPPTQVTQDSYSDTRDSSYPHTFFQPDTSLSPFTVGILNRLLNEADNFSIEQCQFFLSGSIVLEIDNEEQSQRVDNGMAVFIDNTSKRVINIDDKTEGVALRRDGNNLYICFDQDDRYQLSFYAARGENSQFFLNFNSPNDSSSDTKGSLEYGGQNYKLKFNGGRPHLMVKLIEKKDQENHRSEASGRRISNARISETPIPLTTDILNRMRKSAGFSITQYQFFLSGDITLERFDDQKRVRIEKGVITFEDSPSAWYFSIKDKTEGLAVKIDEESDETNIYLCFDQNDRYQLVFSSSGRDPYFYLKSAPLNDPLTDARGSLEYGGQNYRLRFNGGRPYILVSLRQEGGSKTDEHKAPGRKVTN